LEELRLHLTTGLAWALLLRRGQYFGKSERLRSPEAPAKIVYERPINFWDDPGSKDALQFLMTREITDMKVFTAALDSMGKAPFSIDNIPHTLVLVDQYFNDSTGLGDEGEKDARGLLNEGGDRLRQIGVEIAISLTIPSGASGRAVRSRSYAYELSILAGTEK
jgi:hypothetical protein